MTRMPACAFIPPTPWPAIRMRLSRPYQSSGDYCRTKTRPCSKPPGMRWLKSRGAHQGLEPASIRGVGRRMYEKLQAHSRTESANQNRGQVGRNWPGWLSTSSFWQCLTRVFDTSIQPLTVWQVGCAVPCAPSICKARIRRVAERSGLRAPGVWTFSALLNLERMRSLSPGSREAIPKGLNHSAQGCARRATLGGRWVGASTLKGLHRLSPSRQ